MNEATDTGKQRDRRGRPRRTVGAALALSLAISLAACDDSNITASQYIDRAKADFEANDLAAGVIELKNALQKEPGNAEGRFLLGRIYVELGDGASAEKELLRARDLGIGEADLAVPLARAYLSLGRYADVLEALGTASADTDAARAKVAVLRGSANLGLNDTATAETDFRAAIALDPDNADAHIGLARALLPKGAYDEADGELETALAGTPDNPRALEVKGGLRLLQQRYKEAAEIFQKLVEANPTSSPDLLPLAYSQIALGELDAAIGNLDTRLTAAPDDPRAMYLRGLVAFQKQDYATAKQQSDNVLTRNPRDMRATLLSGAASFALNRNEVAYRLLSGYLAEVPNDARARRLLGATELRLGFAEAALNTLRPLQKGDSDDAQLLNMIGTAAVRAGDPTAARPYFERIAALNPDSGQALAQLGMVNLQAGDTEQAIAQLEKALKQDPTMDRALIALAAARLKQRDFDGALDAARKLRQAYPKRALGATMSGLINLAKGDVPQAETAFADALKLEPGAANAGANLAAIYVRAGDAARARTVLQEVLDKHPSHLRALALLVEVETRDGQPGAARERLETAMRTDPDAVEPRILLGRLLLRQRQPSQALEATQGQLVIHPDNQALREVVGRGQLAVGRAADAAITLRPLVEAAPKSADTRFLFALALRGAGKLASYRQQIEKILELQPEHLSAGVARANLRLRDGDIETTTADLARFKARAPMNAQVLELEGNLAVVQGRYADAAKAYGEALRQAASSGLVAKLVIARQRAGDPDGAISVMESWLRQNPDDTGIRSLLGVQYIASAKMDKAEASFKAILKRKPNNAPALNNLAWIETERGDLDAALSHARRANDLASGDAAVQDTLAVVHLRRGEAEQALPLLRDAVQKAPDNPEIGFHLAQALARNDEPDEARRILREILATDWPFRGRADAQALLRELDS